MAAHEDLVAGLLGGAGALFAAWLAFETIQEQFSADERRRTQKQGEAKAVATMCIAPPVQAAASAFAELEKAIKAQCDIERTAADRSLMVATQYVADALSDPAIHEIAGDLGLDDRLIYLSIVGTLRSFVIISDKPSPLLDRKDQLRTRRRALMNIHTYLSAFGDDDLTAVYIRDSGTKPSNLPK